ncbi:hypothetical protein Goklo_027075 [Gossypium klotzschianum]|uniref:Uncharacterized protein n=1 Tax=Gossypium klotzschianum TaxID=34286 RepID=A0A7J8TX19_9ROSI|nr:hypothetical protein [Gossypium klotzschianum]
MKSGYEQCYFCITENRIAAILLKEAAERRRQAERDGIHLFLQHPKVRGRSNSRFPAATVLGVQSRNRRHESNVSSSCLSSKAVAEGSYSRDMKLGPEKPSSLKSDESSSDSEPHEHGKNEKDHPERSNKRHSRKHKSEEKARNRKKKRKDEKRSKHDK